MCICVQIKIGGHVSTFAFYPKTQQRRKSLEQTRCTELFKSSGIREGYQVSLKVCMSERTAKVSMFSFKPD